MPGFHSFQWNNKASMINGYCYILFITKFYIIGTLQKSKLFNKRV